MNAETAIPGSDLDLGDAGVVADLFEQAAEANLTTAGRTGAVVDLPDRGRLLMTGDLHDHTPNLPRILKLARLHKAPDRYLILHEVIHGPGRINGRDLSVRTLARIAALKLAYPDQVLVLQSNHELAQLNGEGILKGGVSVVEAFEEGLAFLFADGADAVRDAMNRYLGSLLLAVRCANGVFCSHSLPSPRKIERFDPSVIDRMPTPEDVASGGSAYDMVWGRHHTQKVADDLGAAWGSRLFLMGHQPAEMGCEAQGDTMLILASDHERGVALPIHLGRDYTRDELEEEAVLLAGVTP